VCQLWGWGVGVGAVGVGVGEGEGGMKQQRSRQDSRQQGSQHCRDALRHMESGTSCMYTSSM
jgi:hypothetical protein